MDSFRYLGKQTLEEVNDMTLEEFRYQLKAYNLRMIDKEYELHKQAYLNLVVQGTRQSGNKQIPVYPTFESFFNKDRYENIVKGKVEPKEDDEFLQLLLAANKEGGKDE